MSQTRMPYAPTWVGDIDPGKPLWAVYDSAEGFSAAWAAVSGDHAEDAACEAECVADGDRINYHSETLMVVRLTGGMPIYGDADPNG